MDAKTLDVINRTIQTHDFDFTTVAGTRIHLPDVQGAAQHFSDPFLEGSADLIERRWLRCHGIESGRIQQP
jgi:hypothetical protein